MCEYVPFKTSNIKTKHSGHFEIRYTEYYVQKKNMRNTDNIKPKIG